jgi:glucose/arabinose dehydrogenase
LNIRTVVLAVVTCCGAARLEAQPVTLVNAFPNLNFTHPVLLTHAGDGSNRVFVMQQNGLIRVFPNDSAAVPGAASTFLNITARLSSTTGEEGLLGLAFHPDYAANGYFYVNYTAPSPLRTVVSRFSVTPGNPDRADSLSEVVLLTVNQPFSNHNGGMLLFGNDGYLYISLGDGGSGGDPNNNAQNINSLLGKILRIDVDTTTAVPYGIPPDNPFVGVAGADEIYAWGLRNPWRCSKDPATGQIWVGDVGQGTWEEIDLLERGRNYGWRCYEGNDPYNTSGCGPAAQYTFPVKQYSSASPNPECSVTGGYVYRGYRRPELQGAYIYGDYCSGKIWKFRYQGGPITEDSLVTDAPFSLSAFGTDALGELYMCNYSGGTIHRFAGPPPTLSTTQYPFVAGWNLVSLPLVVGDPHVAPVFPGAISAAYGFDPDAGYAIQDTMQFGRGYWIKFDSAATVSIAGVARSRDTVNVLPGWNLVGAVSTVVDTGSVVQIPPGILQSAFFGYAGGYPPADSLHPARGYWVRAGSPGRIVLGPGTGPHAVSSQEPLLKAVPGR